MYELVRSRILEFKILNNELLLSNVKIRRAGGQKGLDITEVKEIKQ